MKIETVPIDSIHPDPANARRHPQRNLDAILSSLARFGQQKPIVVDENNIVRAGNGTLAAAKTLGLTHIDIVRTPLKGVDATAFAIADNRTAELAEWDPDFLTAALADPAIGEVGFDEAELQKWLGEDESPSPQETEDTDLNDTFQLVIDCETEAHQKELFEKLSREGWSCRLLTL